jgi:hypothetical protein
MIMPSHYLYSLGIDIAMVAYTMPPYPTPIGGMGASEHHNIDPYRHPPLYLLLMDDKI